MSGGEALQGTGTTAELDGICAELEAELARRSLRSLARAVGMSPSGLAKVLSGGRPYRHTLTKLRAWRTRNREGSLVTEEEALDVLLQRVPERRRAEVREEIRAIVDRGASLT